jgi:hypothetical protein
MINENYDVINDLTVRAKYPVLFNEVCEHDKVSTSSWYSLSDKAYEKYQQWCKIIKKNYSSRIKLRIQDKE